MPVNRGSKKRAAGLGCLLWLGVMALMLVVPGYLTRSMPIRFGFAIGVFVAVGIVMTAMGKRVEAWMYGGDVKGGQILDAYDYLRGLGFFAQYNGVPEEQVLAVLREGLIREWQTDGFPSRTEYYSPILSMDTARAWYYRTEDDDEAPEIEYIEALKGLGMISKGIFQPQEISATYREQEGEVVLSFTLDGTRQSFTIENCEWFETEIMVNVNGLIGRSSQQFYMCLASGLVFAVMLSDSEADSIKKGRILTFI